MSERFVAIIVIVAVVFIVAITLILGMSYDPCC